MTSNQFYVDLVEEGETRLRLRGREHHHLSRVARRKAGDIVFLFDAAGRRFRARILRTGGEETVLDVLEKQDADQDGPRITLAQALIPNRIMEAILKKTTEFGIFEFVPILTNRSLCAIDDRMAGRVSRWRIIAKEAVKQSKGRRVPKICDAVSLKRFISREDEGLKLAFTEKPAGLLRNVLVPTRQNSVKKNPPALTLLIGPKGGWTNREEDDIINHGYEMVSLGRFILRAETAAVAAVACVMHFWAGD